MEEKTDLRNLGDKERDALRKLALRHLKKGVSQVKVAKLLGCHRNSVSNWWKAFKEKGENGIKSNQRGVKKGSRKSLSRQEEGYIRKSITDKMPDQLKLPFALWTRKAVRDLIYREYKVKLALSTTGVYLKSWGMTPQKPKKRAYEQNPELVGKWLEKDYPEIVKQAKNENAEIHWGDETGIKNDNSHGRSYAPKGKTPVKLKMAKRLSLNMISTVTNQGKVRFMTYRGRMDAKMLIKFLKRLIKGHKRKIFLILDNLRVHHAKLVKKWVEENKQKIQLFFLPSYSPEYNPDEYLNCDLKSALSYKLSPRDQEGLSSNVNSHMRYLQRNPERVKKYFNHESIKYAA